MTSFRAMLLRPLEWLIVAVFAILVLNVLWGVVSRYLLGDQARWSEELARLLMVWLAFLGAVLALVQREHLGLDILVQKFHPDARRMALFCVQTIVLFFALIVLAFGGIELTLQSWQSGQTLPALGISKAWFYLSIPISGILMALATLESMTTALHARTHEPDQDQ